MYEIPKISSKQDAYEWLDAVQKSRWLHPLLLLIWLAIGTGLRLTNLAAKPLWNDEFSTIVFSLGNSFLTVPLEQVISLDTLLLPLQPNPQAGIGTVIHNLMTDNHPPIYFVLNHLWMRLFPTEDGMISFYAARSLPAILGAASIPAIFGLGWVAFRSRLVAQMAAAMMAVSPFGIYLAQEARHYTLATLLAIASLYCLVTATRTFQERIPLPIWVGLIWVGVNSLGIAIHYLFILALCTEALVLVGFWIWEWVVNRQLDSYWRQIYLVAAGTTMGGLVWLPFWQRVSQNELTEWIYDGHAFSSHLVTISRVPAWMLTMLSLLPVEGTSGLIRLVSSTVLVIYFIWLLPILMRGVTILLKQPSTRRAIQTLGGVILAAIALFFGITYSLGADLTLAARYHFVYFPAFIVSIAAAIAHSWYISTASSQPSLLPNLTSGKKVAIVVWLMGLVGGLTVVSNFGYQKPDRPDLLVPIIQSSQAPVLISMSHQTHEQTGKLMGLALEFKRTAKGIPNPQFLLAHLESDSITSIETIQKTLTQFPRPLDFWMVNFPASAEPKVQSCVADSKYKSKVKGYRYRLYHCL